MMPQVTAPGIPEERNADDMSLMHPRTCIVEAGRDYVGGNCSAYPDSQGIIVFVCWAGEAKELVRDILGLLSASESHIK